jgi:uncharacterized protein (DUF1330 family)
LAVYVIVAVRAVHDPEKLRQYAEHLDAGLARYGGRRLVGTDQIHVLEGQWRPAELVIFEFPSLEQVQAGYASAEYQRLIPLRHEAIDCDVVVVTGV